MRAVRVVFRFMGAVLATSGVLLLIDAGVTVVWQEPVSALLAGRAQAALRDELDDAAPLAASDRAAVAAVLDSRERLRRLALRARERAETGGAIGGISMPTLDRSYVFLEGTDGDSLRAGPGHYPDTGFPGEGRTVAIAGHRTTYGAPFRPIDELEEGDPIELRMPYGRLLYRVQRTRIVEPSAVEVVRDVGYERLVLTACHPLYSAAQRIVVFARLTNAEEL
jgi:sortase A